MKIRMHRKTSELLFIGLLLIVVLSTFSCVTSTRTESSGKPDQLTFYGGPNAGTFRVFAKGISDLAKNRGINIRPKASSGSYENVRKVNSNSGSMAAAYASHIYQARNGLLKNDSKKYNNIMVLGYFYGAPAQLVVKKDSGIRSAYQLDGKKVGIGNRGSGAAAQAELFFKGIGNWGQIEKKYTGYNDASIAFSNDEIDAFWLFTAFPSGAVIMAAQADDIHLINTYTDGERAGLFKKNPFYEKAIIPKATYKGVDTDIKTFQDSALWIANKKVPDEVVFQLLEAVYSDEGYEYMRTLKKTAQMMADNDGAFGISTPLHPGAVKYYARIK